MTVMTCPICPHSCKLSPGQIGLCGARKNENSRIICSNYGLLTSLALDPIEKKPLSRFMPGTMILSCGSYGCNLKCPFCQNYEISMARTADDIPTTYVSPEELLRKAITAKAQGNIGIAYTYNEPLISYEYVEDCSRISHEAGLKNVLVTNGMVNSHPLRKLLPLIDAINIDLKGFSESFYKKLGGDLQTVKKTIEIASQVCHVEVTTLIISGENDSDREIESITNWIAELSQDIPLHISRFFPRHLYSGRPPTSVARVYELATLARNRLNYVYTGNC